MTLENFLPVFFVACLALVIANAVWAFRDGRRRGRSGILVAMLVLWTFPLGIMLWLAFRPDIVEAPEPQTDPDQGLKSRANAGLL